MDVLQHAILCVEIKITSMALAPETWVPHRQLLDSGIARTIRTERTITRPEVDTVWDLLKSKNKPTTAASERADPCEKWLDQCGR